MGLFDFIDAALGVHSIYEDYKEKEKIEKRHINKGKEIIDKAYNEGRLTYNERERIQDYWNRRLYSNTKKLEEAINTSEIKAKNAGLL